MVSVKSFAVIRNVFFSVFAIHALAIMICNGFLALPEITGLHTRPLFRP